MMRPPEHPGDAAATELSVVAPCFNEERTIPEFLRRVTGACRGLGLSYEIVLVNDGSTDGTRGLLGSLTGSDPCLAAVNLSRNHGHQLALTAGLSVARGGRVLIIDADLQDPPELLAAMTRVMDEAGGDGGFGGRGGGGGGRGVQGGAGA